MTMERKWPGGDVEWREGRVGVMEREQWVVMEREQWVVMETEGTVGGDGDRGNSGW